MWFGCHHVSPKNQSLRYHCLCIIWSGQFTVTSQYKSQIVFYWYLKVLNQLDFFPSLISNKICENQTYLVSVQLLYVVFSEIIRQTF